MKPLKVLVVDDEEEFVKVLSRRLQMRHLDSESALSGEEALELVAKQAPDVMVLDLKMPGIDGMEVLRQVKQAFPKIEVVILTGHGSEEDQEQAMALGALAYLQKPVDINQLVQTLRQTFPLKVGELMIPLSDYATVSQDATLVEAVVTLQKAHRTQQQDRYRHRAVLVHDASGKIVGKMSMLDVLGALRRRSPEIGNYRRSLQFGFGDKFIKAMAEDYNWLKEPLDDTYKRAGEMIVKDVMHTPVAGEYVHNDTTLDEAIQLLVAGKHQSLLVTDEAQSVVGILRLTDVFSELCDKLRATNP